MGPVCAARPLPHYSGTVAAFSLSPLNASLEGPNLRCPAPTPFNAASEAVLTVPICPQRPATSHAAEIQQWNIAGRPLNGMTRRTRRKLRLGKSPF